MHLAIVKECPAIDKVRIAIEEVGPAIDKVRIAIEEVRPAVDKVRVATVERWPSSFVTRIRPSQGIVGMVARRFATIATRSASSRGA